MLVVGMRFGVVRWLPPFIAVEEQVNVERPQRSRDIQR
jgi:hypothetical protein